jgi:hypothetical protein
MNLFVMSGSEKISWQSLNRVRNHLQSCISKSQPRRTYNRPITTSDWFIKGKTTNTRPVPQQQTPSLTHFPIQVTHKAKAHTSVCSLIHNQLDWSKVSFLLSPKTKTIEGCLLTKAINRGSCQMDP